SALRNSSDLILKFFEGFVNSSGQIRKISCRIDTSQRLCYDQINERLPPFFWRSAKSKQGRHMIMKKLMQQFRRVSRSAQALILILAAAALALVLEIGVFHISFF